MAVSALLLGSVVLGGSAATVLGGSAATAAAGPRHTAAAPVTDPAALVDPFIGTAHQGNVFPGADVPFGMVQWSPDTPSRPPGGGYAYRDKSITGFSLTHLSGPGCPAAGDIPVLPTVGKADLPESDSFSHGRESASAGYYRVALGNGVTTQLTATARTGMAEFTFPATRRANLIFKLNDSQRPDSARRFTVVSRTEVRGSVASGGFCTARTRYTVYFDMVFSRPFTASGSYAAVPRSGSGPRGAHLTFSTTSHRVLLAKVGISYVSAAGARANLAAENPGWNFAATRAAAAAGWNALLGRIAVSGGTTAQQRVFYTALYHALQYPSVFSDDNGQYRGEDGRVHTVDPGHAAFYTDISGWDIYRGQAQLEALLDPSAASDTAQSMIDDHAQDGMLPKWPDDNSETYVMSGDPADPVLADYYAFGATGFDTAAALADMVRQATKANNIRPGLRYLNAPGYLPADGRYGCCNFKDPVSTTLEYDTADFAISAFAGALGNAGDQRAFADRAQDWRNVLNAGSGFDQPRDASGRWAGRFTPASRSGFLEGDSWIYTPMVPFDLAGLATAKGGEAAMTAYLDTVLSSYTGARGLAYLGNEPSMELPWEYDYLGEPYRTQLTVRQIQDTIWTGAPGGLAGGNDDLGAMSSWYVWSALGMYPVTPGTADLALGSPLFPQLIITLPSGATLAIDGNGAAASAPYVQAATWDGAPWSDAYAPAGAITSGGTLSYTLAATPDKSWAAAPSQAPPSYGGDIVAPPPPRAGPVGSAAATRLCLGDRHSPVVSGTPAELVACGQTESQQWTIAADGTVRALGLCLEPRRGRTGRGTPADLDTCDGARSQQWTAKPGGSLVNLRSRLCLDDPRSSTRPGTQLQISGCSATRAQHWRLPPAPARRAGAITSGMSSGLCIDDRSGSRKDGNPVQASGCGKTAAQDWIMEPDGTWRVLGRCLDVKDSGHANGTPVDLYACNGTGAQQWRATTAGQLVNTASGRCLTDPGPPGRPATQLRLDACNGTPAQAWILPS